MQASPDADEGRKCFDGGARFYFQVDNWRYAYGRTDKWSVLMVIGYDS